jgi:hypothetical protein
MTYTDNKIMFTALAFFAVIAKGNAASSTETSEEIQALAKLAENYCRETVGDVSVFVSDEPDALVTDQIIERHKQELRENEETRLPEDRQTLIKVHDRLLQRKARRAQQEFYASASEAKLSGLVLALLGEEINEAQTPPI